MFVRVDDLEVFVHERAPDSAGPDPDPAAPVAVLIHGNWSTHRWWLPFSEAIAGELPQLRILAPDLRGRGDTRGPDSGYAIPELAADLIGLLDALALPRVHLVGHSLGTAVVMETALALARVGQPDRIASLTCVAPAWVDGMPSRWHRADVQQQVQDDIALFARMLEPMAPTAPRDAFWQELVTTGHRQRWRATRANLDALAIWQPGDALQSLTMPRLVIDGEDDPLCGGEVARRAAEALDCERVCLPGIGHSPNLEAPLDLAELVADLIRQA